MNKQEVAKLLVIASAGDNRTVGPETVNMIWFPAIGHLEYEIAVEAVQLHFATSTVYLLPAHVIENVRIVRGRRERAARVAGPRAITSNVITLDRSEFDRLTQVAIDNARATKAVF